MVNDIWTDDLMLVTAVTRALWISTSSSFSLLDESFAATAFVDVGNLFVLETDLDEEVE